MAMQNVVLVTFVAVLTVILGSYWVFVVRPEEQARATVKGRLNVAAKRRIIRTGLLKEVERLSEVRALELALARAGALVEPLNRTIKQAGLNTNVAVILLTSGCAAMAAALGALMLTGILWVAAVAASVAAIAPIAVVRQLRTRRLRLFEEQFPEAIDLIARALRAGHAFTTGLSMVGDEAPEPVAAEFRTLYDQQNFGMPLPDAFREFAARVPLLDAQFFATAVLTQRESGGNLSEVLDNLSKVIRDRFRVKRQVRVISAHGRLTGWILTCLPPALAIAFMLTSPDHLQILTNDPIGVRMIEAAVALQIIGTLIIRQLVKIDY